MDLRATNGAPKRQASMPTKHGVTSERTLEPSVVFSIGADNYLAGVIIPHELEDRLGDV